MIKMLNWLFEGWLYETPQGSVDRLRMKLKHIDDFGNAINLTTNLIYTDDDRKQALKELADIRRDVVEFHIKKLYRDWRYW